MPTLFLSHTSIDKPFVEKLAYDLDKLGVDLWYDKYEIKVGESIFWRVEEGLRESEYFAIVLSPDALKSEWVKAELSTAWSKKMLAGNNAILPILYRDCELPSLLRSIKYADFRSSYQTGLSELASVFGIKNIETLTKDTWRAFVGSNNPHWRDFREEEFKRFITGLCKLARRNNYSVWVGGQNKPFVAIVSAGWHDHKVSDDRPYHIHSFGMRMDPSKNYKFSFSCNAYGSPSHVALDSFDTVVGGTVNEALEFASSEMDRFINSFGRPDKKVFYHTERLDKLSEKNRPTLIKEFQATIDWDQDRFDS